MQVNVKSSDQARENRGDRAWNRELPSYLRWDVRITEHLQVQNENGKQNIHQAPSFEFVIFVYLL